MISFVIRGTSDKSELIQADWLDMQETFKDTLIFPYLVHHKAICIFKFIITFLTLYNVMIF